MIPVYSAQQVRQQDQFLIQNMGYPSAQLMEVAGYGVAQWIHRHHPNASVDICCGSGNNGGDGYVIARWLTLWGHSVRCIAVEEPKSADAKLNAERLREAGLAIECVINPPKPVSEILIDAILGTGQRLPLSPSLIDAIEWMEPHNGLRFAIDVPTGLDPNSAQMSPAAKRQVDLTFALGGRKVCYYASSQCGQIVDIDIGLSLASKQLPNAFKAKAHVIEQCDIPKAITSHSGMVKWDKGHVAIVAKRGAAVLAARAALLTGVGLVSVVAPKSEWPHLHGLPPEVILVEPDELNPRRHDALVIGPAWGFEDNDWLMELWSTYPRPLLADADALRVLAQAPKGAPHPRVITPHSAEAAHLLGQDRKTVETDRFGTIENLAKLATVAILKGPYTLIKSNSTLINPVADSRLGVAGSGDILSGLIGGLLAKGHSPLDSTLIGVWHHSRAIPLHSKPSASGILDRLALA